MFHLEGGGDAVAVGAQPQNVDQPHRLGPGCRGQHRRQRLKAALAQGAAVVEAPAVVRGDPDPVAKRMAQVAQPGLHFGMAGLVGLAAPVGGAEGGGGGTRLGQPGQPVGATGGLRRRRRIAARADVEQQPADGAEVV